MKGHVAPIIQRLLKSKQGQDQFWKAHETMYEKPGELTLDGETYQIRPAGWVYPGEEVKKKNNKTFLQKVWNFIKGE